MLCENSDLERFSQTVSIAIQHFFFVVKNAAETKRVRLGGHPRVGAGAGWSQIGDFIFLWNIREMP